MQDLPDYVKGAAQPQVEEGDDLPSYVADAKPTELLSMEGARALGQAAKVGVMEAGTGLLASEIENFDPQNMMPPGVRPVGKDGELLSSAAKQSDLPAKMRKAVEEEEQKLPTYVSEPLRHGMGISQSVATNIPGVAASVLTRNPAPAMAAAGLTVKGGSYEKGREEGLTPAQAASYGTLQAIPEIAFEGISVGGFLKDLGKETFLKTVGKFILREEATELPTTLAQDLIDKATISPDMPLSEFISNLRDTAIQTPFAAGITGGVGAGLNATLNRPRRTDMSGLSTDYEQGPQRLSEDAASDVNTLLEGLQEFTMWEDVPEGFLPGLVAQGAAVTDTAAPGRGAPVLVPRIPGTAEPQGFLDAIDALYEMDTTPIAEEDNAVLEQITQKLTGLGGIADALNYVEQNTEAVIRAAYGTLQTPSSIAEALVQEGRMLESQRDAFIRALEKSIDMTRLSDTVKQGEEMQSLFAQLEAKGDKLRKPNEIFSQEYAEISAVLGPIEDLLIEKAVHNPLTKKESDELKMEIRSVLRQVEFDTQFGKDVINTLKEFNSYDYNGPIKLATLVSRILEYSKNRAQGKLLPHWQGMQKAYNDSYIRGGATIPTNLSLRNLVEITLTDEQLQEGGHIQYLGTAKDPERAQQFDTLIRTMLKKFAPDMNVSLDMRPQSDAGNTLMEMWYGEAEKLTNIRIYPRSWNAGIGMLEQLAHEMAHGVVMHNYTRAPMKIKNALFNAWYAQLEYYMLHGTVKEQQKYARGTDFLRRHDDKDARSYSQAVLHYLANPRANGVYTSNYLPSFVEWTAHHGERWFNSLYDGGNDPEVQDWLKTQAKNYEQMFREASDGPNKTWLDFNNYMAEYSQNRLLEQLREFRSQITAILLMRSPADVITIKSVQNILAEEEAGVPAEVMNGTASLSGPMNKVLKKFNIRPTVQANKNTGKEKFELDSYNWASHAWQGLLNLAWKNPHIVGLFNNYGTGYVNRTMQWANLKMKWMARANTTLKMMHKLGRERMQQLTDYMLEETVQGEYFNHTDMDVVKDLQTRYPLLDEQAMEVYGQVQKDFQDFITAVQKIQEDNAIDRLSHDPMLQGQELKKIRSMFTAMRRTPYFPLARFGNWMLYANATEDMEVDGTPYKKGDLIEFTTYKSETDQQRAAAQLKRKYPSIGLHLTYADDTVKSLVSMPRPLIEGLKDTLQLDATQKEMLDEYLYKVAPSQSWVKHMIKRKYTKGYSREGMQVYADYFFHGANHLARLRFGKLMHDQVLALRNSIRQVEPGKDNPINTVRRAMIANWVENHYEYVMNPQNEWEGARSFGAIAYLGGMIKSAFVNLTQVPAYTLPYLGSKFGDAKAVKALLEQYEPGKFGRTHHVLKGLTKQEETVLAAYRAGAALTPTQRSVFARLMGGKGGNVTRTIGLISALQRAIDAGFLNESNATELAAMSEGGWLSRYRATGRAQYYGRTMAHGLMVPFQMAEKLNRQVTFAAAYELAFDETGGDTNAAYNAARDAVYKTQFEYAKWNRAPMLRGKKSVLFLFWQYRLNALSQIASDKQFFWRWALMSVALGGLWGLPFMSDMEDLLNWILTKMNPNKPGNVKLAVKKELEELFGEGVTDIALHGTSRYGFGLIPTADLSGAISMGDVIPMTDVFFGPTGLLSPAPQDWKDLLTQSVQQGGGAAVSLGVNMFRALGENDMPMMQRLLLATPSSMIQSLGKAYEWADRGEARTSGGTPQVTFDMSDPWQAAEVIGKGLGFHPRSAVTGAEGRGVGGEFQWLLSRTAAYYQTRRGLLMRGFAEAVMAKDKEAEKEALREILQFNQETGRLGLAINGKALRSSVKNRLENQEMRRRGMHRAMPGLAQDLRGEAP